MAQNFMRCICLRGRSRFELDTQSSIEIIHDTEDNIENEMLNIALDSQLLDSSMPAQYETGVSFKSVGIQADDLELTDIQNHIDKLEAEIQQLGIRKSVRNISTQTDDNVNIPLETKKKRKRFS